MSGSWGWLRPSLLPCTVQTASLVGPREENQDNYLVIATDTTGQATDRWLANQVPSEAPHPGWSPRWIRLALLDGIGGHAQGREIAEAAALELRTIPPCTTLEKQRLAVLSLHHRLQIKFAGTHTRSPGTTLVWAEIDRRRRICNLLNVGDSRAWLWTGIEWQRLTWDHTLLEFNFRDGRVNQTDYLLQLNKPEHRIAQALGYGSWGMRPDGTGHETFGFDNELRIDTIAGLSPWAKNHPDIYTLELSLGSMLLLSSDGLWNATRVRLPNPIITIPNMAHSLAQEALDVGGQDNTTLVLGVFSPDNHT